MDRQTALQELMDNFEFTERDLQFNQSGQISPEQRKRLEQDSRLQILFLVSTPIVIYVIQYIREPENLRLLLSPLYLVLTLGLLFYLFRRGYWRNQKALQGNVEKISGVAELKHHPKNFFNRRGYYDLFVNEKKFRFPDTIEAEFVDGVSFTFYYSPHLDWSFSIEPL